MRNLFQYISLLFSFVVCLSRTFCQWMCLIVLSLFSPPGLFGSPVPGSTFTLAPSLLSSLQGPHTGLTGFYLSQPYQFCEVPEASSDSSISCCHSLYPTALPLDCSFCCIISCLASQQNCLLLEQIACSWPRSHYIPALYCLVLLSLIFKKSLEESMDRKLIGSFCP